MFFYNDGIADLADAFRLPNISVLNNIAYLRLAHYKIIGFILL